MSTAQRRPRPRRHLSLSVRLSLILLCAALLPLAAVVGITNYLARNALIQQGRTSLSTAANAKVDLIDAYLHERVQDGQALASLPTAQYYLACLEAPALVQQLPPNLAAAGPLLAAGLKCETLQSLYVDSVKRALNVGIVRDQKYTVWSIYDATANQLLTSGPGQSSAPKADLAALKQGQAYISDVRYDAKANYAYVHFYTPIKLDLKQVVQQLSSEIQLGQLVLPPQLTIGQLGQIVQGLQALPDPTLGFLQATLRLDDVSDIVAGEQGANGTYAFIVDQHGIRVADPKADERFTAVMPLDASTQQVIQDEQRFGSASVRVMDLPDVAAAAMSSDRERSFQSVATPGAKIPYQFVAIHMKQARWQTVPWTYYVLSPLSAVTQVADDQVRTSLLAAAVVALLAILLGLIVGMRTAAPVQRSVANLRDATEVLNALAAKQRNSSSEQQWVVDACKTGLESVRYLSDAMHQAAHRIGEAGNWFGQYWDRLNEDQAQRTVQHLRELSQYIEEAARRQWASSERLDKAITVTTQVSDQLASGASAAAESAEQLEHVVSQLQSVVGGPAYHHGARSMDEAPYMDGMDPMNGMHTANPMEHMMPAAGPMGDARGRRPAMPAPVGPRQMEDAPAQNRQGGQGQALMPGNWSSGPSGPNWGTGYERPNQQMMSGYGPPNAGAQREWSDMAANGPGVRVWEER
jgi:hypothetical protein